MARAPEAAESMETEKPHTNASRAEVDRDYE